MVEAKRSIKKAVKPILGVYLVVALSIQKYCTVDLRYVRSSSADNVEPPEDYERRSSDTFDRTWVIWVYGYIGSLIMLESVDTMSSSWQRSLQIVSDENDPSSPSSFNVRVF